MILSHITPFNKLPTTAINYFKKNIATKVSLFGLKRKLHSKEAT